MKRMIEEILEIPMRAKEFWDHSKSLKLPLKVPYLGMGSSYFAPLAFKYMNINIYPDIASEFYHYQSKSGNFPQAVILSQSGRSSEALWCAKLFKTYIAISNNPNGELCKFKNAVQTISLLAGDEQYSSSKTYINTLLALFKGFGFEVNNAINLLNYKIKDYELLGEKMANEVYDLIIQKRIHGIYITGSGPNIATAYEASLILSESTKICFNGLPMAQYDHGPKETAAGSIVIQIMAKGKSYERTQKLNDKITKVGANVFTVEEPEVEENLSIIHNMIPFNFMAYYLARKMNIENTFIVGGKVTETD